MKRLLVMLLIVFVCLGITACDPAWYYHYDNEERISNIVSVELVNYNNSDEKEVSTYFSTRQVQQFDFEKLEVLEVIEGEGLSILLQHLSGIEIWGGWNHSDSPFGISLRVIYNNGEFDVVSSDDERDLQFFARFESNGRLSRYLGMFLNHSDFVELINTHFNIQVG